MIFKFNHQTGLTIVEALVAIAIFSIALGGALVALSINGRAAVSIKNSLLASYLAQEGIEVVRNLRDADWHAGRAFGSFGGVGPVSDGNYLVQWDSLQFLPSADVFLKHDEATGIFSYSTGDDSIFKRTIELISVSAVEKRATVTVNWNERGTAKTLSAEDHLFNWR